MKDSPACGILGALKRSLGPRWEFRIDDEWLQIRHSDAESPFRPPRRPPDWPELLNQLEASFARSGVSRAQPLPLSWGRETDFTISAIQALDPYLKHRRAVTYRQGYLPQPVIRFTGECDHNGRLREGYLTSFVNISRIQPVAGIDDHAAIADGWISVLSDLGLHARHIEMRGRLRVWSRGNVRGTTIHFKHKNRLIGDIVLMWNSEDPTFLATDLGSGLERLRWAITGQPWSRTVFGAAADQCDSMTLDALRTATLAVGSGIRPAHRGCGGATRRILRSIPAEAIGLGVGTAVRTWHQYWSMTTQLHLSWPEIAYCVEEEVLGRAGLYS